MIGRVRTRNGRRIGAPVSQRLLVGGMLAVSGMLAVPQGVAAQAGLEQVEQLTRLGRTEEARDALMGWWSDERPDASRRDVQRGLWLRGRLTVDPIQAELDFRRLAVLYPSGQFTPDAIMRLAQASFAMGDEAAARRYVATLVRDYPRAEARDRAEVWLADAGPVPPPGDTPTRAVSLPDAEGAMVADSVKTESAGEAEAERVDPGDADIEAVGEVADDEVADDEDSAAEDAEPVVNYYVQLGAFAEEERAFALHAEVDAAGVEVRVVRVEGSRFTHVRVGRFSERSAAVDVLEELTAQGISAALVRDDREEEQIRD